MNKPVEGTKKRRTPLSQRNRLTVKNQEAGYQYRIVNDLDDRVEEMKERGYEVVAGAQVGDRRVDTPSAIGSAGVISVGNSIKAVVMRQKIDWFQEDQASKQAEIDALDNSMSVQAKKGF